MSDADDRAQLRAYAENRDQDAFAQVVSRHTPLVLGACRRICGQADAEDAAQAAFLVLADKAAAVAAHPSPAAWLHRTATQVALRSRRGETARTRREQEVASMASARHEREPDPAPELDAALASLPASYRHALVAHYLEGREPRALAQESGVSADALAMRLSRGRDLLRRALARRGVAVSGAALLLALGEAGHATESVLAAVAAPTANELARTHLRALAQARGLGYLAAAGVVACIAIPALILGFGLTRPSTPASPPVAQVERPLVAEPASAKPSPSPTGDPMSVQIIDRPFTRTLYGKATMHDPARTYSQEIIGLLDQVWPAVKDKGIKTTGINHVAYDLDGTLFAGVEATIADPAGLGLVEKTVVFPRYAYVKHIGSYAKLPQVYKQLDAEVVRLGLTPSCPRLEIYGHWTDDESKLETEILTTVR